MYVNQIIAENAVKFNAFGKIIRSKRGLFGVLHNLKMLYSNHSPFFVYCGEILQLHSCLLTLKVCWYII